VDQQTQLTVEFENIANRTVKAIAISCLCISIFLREQWVAIKSIGTVWPRNHLALGLPLAGL
jgi:hypothetical protein